MQIPNSPSPSPHHFTQAISLVLPDRRHAVLYPDGRLVIIHGWQAGSSPIDFLQHLSGEETKLLERLFAHYPSICPLSEACTPHLPTRIAKGRLYGVVTTLRLKLAGSGLALVPVTGEGYLLAHSRASGPDVLLVQCLLTQEMGIAIAPSAELAVVWQQDRLLHFQRFSRFQMRLLLSLVEEYPHYCPYERLLAARKNIPYDPNTATQLLERHPRQKDALHNAVFAVRQRLCELGLCLKNYQDIGYQLQTKEASRRSHSA